jgi:hypothetical protein
MFSGTFLRIIRKWVVVPVLLALPLVGQTGLGVVRGTVQDPSKAVVPVAKATLVNNATGVMRSALTNVAGIYYFDAVPIGSNTLTIEAAGFKKWESTLNVEAGQTLVVDPNMEVGSVDSIVEVTGNTFVVATEGAQVSDVKDALTIHDLPMNGRQISNLFDLTAGVEGGGNNTRTNGMKVGSTEMLLDGNSYVDRFGGAIARVQPGLDTIQEFRIETAGSSAEFSRPATIELVTRSGSNDLHGALFETFRNNADGLRARQRQDGSTSAKLIRNEYGGWVGGPVRIPKLYNGKNKTFFFFDYEGMKQRQKTFATTGVATPSMWAGNLSNITDFNGDKFTIYDPTTTQGPNGVRLPFANNTIPSSRLNPIAKAMQSVSPLPSGPNAGGNPWIEQNFQTYYPITTNQHTYTIRIDHNFSANDTLSGRFTNSPYNYTQAGGQYGFPPPGCTNCGGTAEQDYKVYSEYIRYNHVFSPTFLNELQLSSFRSAAHYGTLGDSTNWATKLGFPNPFGVTGWPTIYAAQSSGDPTSNMFYGGGWDGDNNHHQNLTSFQIDDSVTWVKGKHTLKFGFKGRKEYNNVEELQQAEGSHDFYGSWTGLYDPSAQAQAPFTGAGFASLLLGLPTNLRDQYNRGYFYFQQKEIGLYVNDTWKVSPRLTIGLGLRWDHWTPYHEAQNRLVSLDPTNYIGKFQVITPGNTTLNSLPNIPSGVLGSWAAAGLTWVTANQVPGFPSALIPNYWKDFGPRLSAAYQISNKWVIRGGYGMYYWPMPLSQILQASRTNPPLNLDFHNGFTDLNGAVPNWNLLNAPGTGNFLPNATVNVNGIVPLTSTSKGIFIFDPHNWADDRMQQWTVTIERELMKNTVFRLSYIGTHGSNLEQRIAFNSAEAALNYEMQTGLVAAPGAAGADSRRPNPNWNGTVESHVGYSNSNSVQAEIQRHFSSGLGFQLFYTYDHALTTSDENGTGDGSGGALVPLNSTILGDPNLSLSQRLKLVYYNSGMVPPQRVTWNGIYELPFGRGKRFGGNASKALNEVVGGWQLAFLGTWSGGNWIGVKSGDYLFGNPALSNHPTLTIFGKNQELWFAGDFDPTSAANINLSTLEALVNPNRAQRTLRPIGANFNNQIPFLLANGTIHNTSITDLQSWNAQNFMLSPGNWDADMSIFKYFEIAERVKLRVTADFFNVFNHPVNYLPGGGTGSADLNLTTGLLDLSRQVNDPRIIQFSTRLEW